MGVYLCTRSREAPRPAAPALDLFTQKQLDGVAWRSKPSWSIVATNGGLAELCGGLNDKEVLREFDRLGVLYEMGNPTGD
jgi:hypothetical protein